jgi:hypothetical protein
MNFVDVERKPSAIYDVLYASNSHASQRAFRFLHIFTSPPQMNFWELKVCFSIKSAYISLSCCRTIEDQNLAPLICKRRRLVLRDNFHLVPPGAIWNFAWELYNNQNEQGDSPV